MVAAETAPVCPSSLLESLLSLAASRRFSQGVLIWLRPKRLMRDTPTPAQKLARTPSQSGMTLVF